MMDAPLYAPPIKRLMDDVGTRYDHLGDLLDLWKLGLEILSRKTFYSTEEKQEMVELEAAVKLLSLYMTAAVDRYAYARVINSLPKNAADIKD